VPKRKCSGGGVSGDDTSGDLLVPRRWEDWTWPVVLGDKGDELLMW
jgi:hypothetical protein